MNSRQILQQQRYNSYITFVWLSSVPQNGLLNFNVILNMLFGGLIEWRQRFSLNAPKNVDGLLICLRALYLGDQFQYSNQPCRSTLCPQSQLFSSHQQYKQLVHSYITLQNRALQHRPAFAAQTGNDSLQERCCGSRTSASPRMCLARLLASLWKSWHPCRRDVKL